MSVRKEIDKPNKHIKFFSLNHLGIDLKWPNYRGMAVQYLMPHQNHLVFYFWCTTMTATATTTALTTSITLATALAITLVTALATALAIAISNHRCLWSTATTTAAIAVAMAATTNVHFYCSRCWLVVVLFSAICLHHRTPSCDHQRSCCRSLLPPIVVHRRHRRGCRCRKAATTTTATPVVKLTIVHCRRQRQQQQHHQRTNGSPNVKTFTSPVDLDLLNLSTVFEVCDVGWGNLAIRKLLALKKFGPFLQSTY